MRPRLLVAVTVLLALAFVLSRAPMPARRTPALGAFGHGPEVVLVHGLGSDAEHWMPMARDLARDHRVVLVELAGHGLAEAPSPFTLEAAAHELDRAIAEQCRQPVVLVGHSVGGLVAAAAALDDPARVRALVLVETALRPQVDAATREQLLAALDRDYRGTLHESYLGFGRDSLQGEALFRDAERVDSTTMKAWIRIAVTADLSPRMSDLTVPALAVLSERSWPAGEDWRACADTLGYGRIRLLVPARIAGTGHFVMLDRPGELADLVRRFERGMRPQAIAALAR